MVIQQIKDTINRYSAVMVDAAPNDEVMAAAFALAGYTKALQDTGMLNQEVEKLTTVKLAEAIDYIVDIRGFEPEDVMRKMASIITLN